MYSIITPQHRKTGARHSVPKGRRQPPQSGASLVNRLWSAATWAAYKEKRKKHREARASPQLRQVAGGNASWITPDFSPVETKQRKRRFGDTPHDISKEENTQHLSPLSTAK